MLRATVEPRVVSRRLAVGAAAVGASLVTAYTAVVMPFLLNMLIAAGVATFLAVAAAEVVLFFTLLGRNVADASAEQAVFAGLNLGGALGVLVVAVAAARVSHVPRIRALGPSLFLSFAFAVWAIVGYANYGDADGAFTRELIRAMSIVAVGLIAANIRRERHLRIVDAVLLAGCVPALVAIYQMLTGAGYRDTDRAYGTLAHPSTAGAIFALCLSIALWRLLEGEQRRRYAALSLVFAVALLATQSLGAIAQVLVTLMAYGFLRNTGGARGRLAAALGVALVLVFALSPIGSERAEELRTTTSFAAASEGQTTNTLDWRFLQWSKLIDSWQERPVLGHGLGATNSLVTPQENIPHSDFLRMLVETGLLGTVVLLAALIVLCVRLYRHARTAHPFAALHSAVLAIVVGLILNGAVNNVFGQTATMYAAAALVGCAAAAAATTREIGS